MGSQRSAVDLSHVISKVREAQMAVKELENMHQGTVNLGVLHRKLKEAEHISYAIQQRWR